MVPLSIVVFAPISTSSSITTDPNEGILNTFWSYLPPFISPSFLADSILSGFSVTKLKPSAPMLAP